MEEQACTEAPLEQKKNWGTGGGLYRGVSASVKTMNWVIGILMIALLVVLVYLSSTSSYTISFEVNGGERLPAIHQKYGEALQAQIPIKTGYVFDGWYQDEQLSKPWKQELDTIAGSGVLYAKWLPAAIRVCFDLTGGSVDGVNVLPSKDLLFHEPYGTLPVVEKEGFTFIGWQYDGVLIQADQKVAMNGEHTLQAIFQ